MFPVVLIDGEKFDLIPELSHITEKVSRMVEQLENDNATDVDVWCKLKGVSNLLDAISLLL